MNYIQIDNNMLMYFDLIMHPTKLFWIVWDFTVSISYFICLYICIVACLFNIAGIKNNKAIAGSLLTYTIIQLTNAAIRGK